MDPVVTLKRPSSVDLSLCIFCQIGGDGLRNASTQGIETITKAVESRKKLRDYKTRTVIDRLASAMFKMYISSGLA